jgi:hypothetical protein
MKIEYQSTIDGLHDIEDARPVKYLDIMPKWFKEMPNFSAGVATARKCPSFTDLFRYSYVMRMWCDLRIEFSEDRDVWQWGTPADVFELEEHPALQFQDYFSGPYLKVLKLVSPWELKTPEGYSVLQQPLAYTPNPLFDTIPGIIHTDVYHGTNPQLLIKDMKPGEKWSYTIPRGTPLVAHIPFKRDSWDLEVGDEGKYLANKSLVVARTKFKDSYRSVTKGFLE